VLSSIGPFVGLSEIGRGGMGVVYRGRGPDGREVAVKVLLGTNPDAIAQFEREKRLLWNFALADGFVPILDAAVENGKHYIVMPFLAGGTLRGRLHQGPLPPEEALPLVARLARAIGKAHERGIIHRDLKPENVLFDEKGTPLVADLGLAKHFRREVLGASQSRSLSATGSIVGTPGYMAPEQIEDSSKVGPASDVFALGVILHECVAGEPPFVARGLLDYADAIQTGPRPLPKTAPPWLGPILARALTHDPRERFPDGSSLAAALERQSPKGPLLPKGSASAKETASRRSVVLLAVASVATIAVCVGAVIAWSPPSLATQPPPPVDTRGSERIVRERAEQSRHAEDLARSALAHSEKGELDAALAEANKAIALAPGLRDDLVRKLLEHADADREAKRNETALAAATLASELDPSNVMAWLQRAHARVLLPEKDLDAVIADYTKALELDHGNLDALEGRADGYTQKAELETDPTARRDDLEHVITDRTRAIELAPKDPDHLAWRAYARRKRGENELAEEDASRALEMKPGDRFSLEIRLSARFALGNLDGAIDDGLALRYVDHVYGRDNPGYVEAWIARAKRRHAAGDDAGALEDYSNAIELVEGASRAWLGRGLLHADRHETQKALEDLGRALELGLGPDDAATAKAKMVELGAGSR
jgi:tetratricopeptide (TPR) repeat protein